MSLTCLNSKFSLKLGKALITVILVMFLLLVTYNHMSFSVISMFGILTAVYRFEEQRSLLRPDPGMEPGLLVITPLTSTWGAAALSHPGELLKSWEEEQFWGVL